MISKGKRRGGQPLIVADGQVKRLDRVPFLTTSFNEDWIQQLIHDQPALLPVDEIDGSFAPLIPIGREVTTGVGSIDNLFISPDGQLTIVETKLWRNPEARREVVGQILDYAKELSKWTFADLDRAAMACSNRYHGSAVGLLETIRHHHELDDSDESALIDDISRNLQRGRFLLLIVGDGIRESVEDMVEYLSQHPQLHFTLALVELRIYSMGDAQNALIILPEVITRTKEITRAVIRVEGQAVDNIRVVVETDLGTEADALALAKARRVPITVQDFFDQLERNTDAGLVDFAKRILDDAGARGYKIDWASGSFVVKLDDPNGSGERITLFVVDRSAKLYIGLSAKHLEDLGVGPISHAFALDTSKLFPNLFVHPDRPHNWSRYQNLKGLQAVYPQFLARVDQFAAEITAALR